MNKEIDLFADVENPSEDGLSRLSRLYRDRSRLSDRVEELKAELKVTEEELRILDEVQFPELFDEVGVTSFSVGNHHVTLQEKLYGSLPKDPGEQEEAMKLLKSHGGESLVKVSLSVDFNKGEAKHAARTAEAIKAAGYNPVVKETVHAQTLQKFGRDMIERGEVIDLKKLGLYHRRFVKIS